MSILTLVLIKSRMKFLRGTMFNISALPNIQYLHEMQTKSIQMYDEVCFAAVIDVAGNVDSLWKSTLLHSPKFS